MILITSVDIILNTVKSVKDQKKGYLTNFFLDNSKAGLWIGHDLFYYEKIGETTFLFRKNEGFFNLFFITNNTKALEKDLDTLSTKYSGDIFVADIIGIAIHNQSIMKLFERTGFYLFTSLVRMSKINTETEIAGADSDYISYIDEQKAQCIYDLLHQHFDPYAEQLPMIDEVNELSSKKCILSYSDDNKTIQGFLIFELVGLTLYLRYWFVHPDHREKKIGSALLRRFFEEGKKTRRQIFWVIESNYNAIKRYEHYGFIKEQLFDYIMINKNISYGG